MATKDLVRWDTHKTMAIALNSHNEDLVEGNRHEKRYYTDFQPIGRVGEIKGPGQTDCQLI